MTSLSPPTPPLSSGLTLLPPLGVFFARLYQRGSPTSPLLLQVPTSASPGPYGSQMDTHFEQAGAGESPHGCPLSPQGSVPSASLRQNNASDILSCICSQCQPVPAGS